MTALPALPDHCRRHLRPGPILALVYVPALVEVERPVAISPLREEPNMHVMLKFAVTAAIGVSVLAMSTASTEATTIVRSKSNICNNRVYDPNGHSACGTTNTTDTETTTTDTSCPLAGREYAEGVFICNGPQVSLTCKEGKWLVQHAGPAPGGLPVIAEACKGAPFVSP